jgi:aminoglycoside/choline kinase family phosphotransferase
MDSKQNQDEQQNCLLSWLNQACGLVPTAFTPMPADAGARYYFLAHCREQSFVVMDARNVKESCPPFIAIGNALRQLGLKTPEILAADLDRGYLLLTYFGEITYLKALMSDADAADRLYEQALSALTILHTCTHVPNLLLPHFDNNWMWQEWTWHKEWFLNNLLGLFLTPEEEYLLDRCYQQIVNLNTSQPQVLMHRDFHSANLMVLNENNENNVGLLDFQDAFIGPVTYDLVSLLRDCYIDWPTEKVHKWVLHYFHQLQLNVSEQTFLHWFDWMGLERHLKALFTFARKYVRDHDARYLAHCPRTLKYILQVSAGYPELKFLHQYYQNIVEPVFLRVLSSCVR